MWRKIRHIVEDKIVGAIAKSRRPVSELALTNLIGLFWAFTPLVGIQMTLVLINWFLFRLLRIEFHLAIALAWVWLSNPLTMPILYFSFYVCGFFLLQSFDKAIAFVSFTDFSKVLEDANQMSLWEGALHWLNYVYDLLLWPMFLGSALIAIPLALLGYVLTTYLVNHHRSHKAKAMGISLHQWEKRFVKSKVISP